jgi:hypothetical protein
MRMLESLQGAPYLLRAGDAGADAHSGEAALDAAIGDGLRDAEREADGRVGEGHDGGDDGQPPNLVKVGNLREEDLRGAEQDHVRVAGAPARIGVAVAVEAPGPPDGPHADGGGDGVPDS